MGNSKSKQKKQKQQQIQRENILKEELQQIEIDKLPNENDLPNNKTEYKLIIQGYIKCYINKSNDYIISSDIINIIVLFYPFHFIFEQKALKICKQKRLKDGLTYLFKQYDNGNLNIDKNYYNKAKYCAMFLYYKHPYLDKQEIGEFISTLECRLLNQKQHKSVVVEYFKFIDFKNLSVENAFRKFLNSGFYLPREAPKIDKLIDVFGEWYIECNKANNNKLILTKDDVIILSYAMLMLNTELHNTKLQNQQPMVKDAFRNLANGAGSHNIPTSMIDDIYDSIQKNPLRI